MINKYQFDKNPNIEDLIKALEIYKELGYTNIEIYEVPGDYNYATMDLDIETRIEPVKN